MRALRHPEKSYGIPGNPRECLGTLWNPNGIPKASLGNLWNAQEPNGIPTNAKAPLGIRRDPWEPYGIRTNAKASLRNP
eukprot:8923085-Pyramimonas_sp.AAC.1